MHYPQTKVYFDGSHYIGIPHTEQPWKQKKKNNHIKSEENEKIKQIYKSCNEKTKKEKAEKTIQEINKQINDIEKSKALVNSMIEKEKRNKIVRITRLMRKVRLQQWTHFCTFTYDSNKLNEDEFKTKLLNCIRHFSHRKDWKYVGVFERSTENNRLHFHGLFLIPQMIGDIIETHDYSTKNHKMQIAHQNTFFLDKFGRNDFKPFENGLMIDDAVKYILKYIQKTGEKVIYSRHLQTYFITDILEEDVVCQIGQENRKLLLFDNFECLDFETGEVFGKVSKQVIEIMPKGY